MILYSIREYLQKLNEFLKSSLNILNEIFREDLRKEDLQLISLVMIQIIAKIYELRPPNYEELSHLCSRCYSAEDFKRYEEKSKKINQ